MTALSGPADFSQLLQWEERARNAIRLGESQFREFKSAFQGEVDQKRRRPVAQVARDVGEALVAFANADGGELLVGVEDDGTISGISYDEDSLNVLKRAPKTHVHQDTPLPSVEVRIVELDAKSVCYFTVPKSTQRVCQTVDGRCVQRRDREVVPVSLDNIREERREHVSREYDRNFVDGATVPLLDLDLLKRVAQTVTPGMSVEKCLQYLGLAEYEPLGLRLRRAALLLFAKDIGRWHPRCQLRIMRIMGTQLKSGREYNIINDDMAVGSILVLLTKGWELIRPHLVHRRFAGETGTFQGQVAYPEDAIREAFYNAIAHRDYSIEGRGIEIHIYDDRMEVRSPGVLLSTVKLSDLERPTGVHDSRNAYIARTLRELEYMREMGEGMRRIHDLMNQFELEPPRVGVTAETFIMTFSQRNVFTSEEQRWLDAFADFKLNRDEKIIVLLGRGQQLFSPQQIWKALDLVDTDEYRAIVEQLQVKGLIASEVSGNAARARARRTGTSAKEIARFVIRSPSLAQRDQREVVETLSRFGVREHVVDADLKDLSLRLSRQNVYFGNNIRLLQLLRWLGLMDAERKPTERLRSLWVSGDVVERRTSATDAVKAGLVSAVPTRDIYVGNLDGAVSELDLRNLFGAYSSVQSVVVPRDYVTGTCCGYAFIRMIDMAAAQKAVSELAGKEFKGKPLRLGWSYR